MAKLNNIFITACLEHSEREFDTAETMKLLILTNQSVYMSWGVSRKYNLENKAVLLYVDGHHHTGWVLITLAFNDTYTVTIFEDIRKIIYQRKDVYFDELQRVIDEKIEKIDGYTF